MELLRVREVGIVGEVNGDLSIMIKEGNIEDHTRAQMRITGEIVDGNYVKLVII